MSVGWGLKDKEFFEQSIPKVKIFTATFLYKIYYINKSFSVSSKSGRSIC